MSDEKEMEKGTLSSGREWHLVLCREPDVNLVNGRHLILEGVGQPTPDQLIPKELAEIRLLTFKLAEELASEPGRWRVDFNGPSVATQKHFHAHIKLPAGGDKLSRLVG
jgi:hypothetical protein